MENGTTNTAFDPNSLFETVKHVTLPQLKLEAGVPIFVRITSEIRKADPVAPSRNRTDGTGNAAPTMEPPKLVNVDDLVSKQPKQMIVNEVVGKELEKQYPDHGYINRSFKITLINLQGKRYKGAEVIEIRLKTDTTAQDHAAKGKGK